jgi:hypothetical protein
MSRWLPAGPGLVGKISRPTTTFYSPKEKNMGAAVVVFPGGGYWILAIDLEGTEVCDWLTSKAITCVLLKYRVPGEGPFPRSGSYPFDSSSAARSSYCFGSKGPPKMRNPRSCTRRTRTILAHELYNSNQAPGWRDYFGEGNKFITPMIAHGKV